MAALDNALEAMAVAAKRTRRLDTAFEESLAVSARAARFERQATDAKMKAILEREVDEFNRANAGAAAKPVVETQAVKQAALADIKAAEETRRVAGVTDPKVDIDYRHQTNGPDEFKQRMSQLRDAEFASKAVVQVPGNPNAGPSAAELLPGLKRDEAFQTRVQRSRSKDPRYNARLSAVVGDTAYVTKDGTPQVMVHIDGMTDPVRANTGEFIQQLDEAYELGLHSGTNEAAIGATVRDPAETARRVAEFDREIGELDFLADMDGDVEKSFVNALNEFFLQKFTRGEDAARSADVFDEFEKFATEAMRRVNMPEDTLRGTVRQFVSRMKQLPIPNSTPHYFNGQNGLYMQDTGGWKPQAVFDQLVDIFPDDTQSLDALFGAATGQAEKTAALRSFIEGKGYDHVVYHNTVEDIGSISVIHWKSEQMVSIFDPRLTKNSATGKAASMAAYVMGGVFGVEAMKEAHGR